MSEGGSFTAPDNEALERAIADQASIVTDAENYWKAERRFLKELCEVQSARREMTAKASSTSKEMTVAMAHERDNPPNEDGQQGAS